MEDKEKLIDHLDEEIENVTEIIKRITIEMKKGS